MVDLPGSSMSSGHDGRGRNDIDLVLKEDLLSCVV
jgi:hypothetical protein